MIKNNLQLHMGEGFDGMANRIADAWHRAEAGQEVHENHVTFASWDLLAQVMTTKRLALLRHLHSHSVANIATLARELGRDYKRVHGDVSVLTAAGLLQRDAAGLHADYDTIESRIAL